jgi:hypothetical protein
MYQTSNLENKTEIVGQRAKKNEFRINKDGSTDSVFITEKYFTDGTMSRSNMAKHWIPGAALESASPKISNLQTITINQSDKWTLIWLVFIQVIFVTMVYGPIAAFLVELFPTRIRYTSMSLPYHIGNGVFGGLLPAVATYLATNAQKNGDANWYLEGLWYPIGVATVCLVIGIIYINGKDREIDD